MKREFIEDSNAIVKMEIDRLLSKIVKKGFIVTQENSTKMFLQMCVESLGNKLGTLLSEPMCFTAEEVEEIILSTISCFTQMLYAMNNNLPKDIDDLSEESYKNMIEVETLIASEMLDILTVIKKL